MDEAVRSAEVELLGWTAEEVEKAQGQACLAFEFGGHDMQPRTDDRHLLRLAAWLESMEDDSAAAGWRDGQMARWLDGRMAGWPDGQIARWPDG